MQITSWKIQDFIATKLINFFQRPAMKYLELEMLEKYCKDKNVAEYGSGYSTVFLQGIANNVISFEGDEIWATKIRPKLTESVRYIMGSRFYFTPATADVYFVDDNKYRTIIINKIIASRKDKNYVILLHDWRRQTYEKLLDKVRIVDFAGTLAVMEVIKHG
jgi:hypothetical protein